MNESTNVTTCVVVWIEILQVWKKVTPYAGHHLRGGVDWNIQGIRDKMEELGHHLRGGVD